MTEWAESKKPAHLAVVFVIAMLAAGCAPSQSASPVKVEKAPPVTLTPIESAAVMDGVKGQLKDPESARFGEFVASRKPGTNATVCGTVNSKNSYGGYAGPQPFSGMLISRDGKAVFAAVGIGGTETMRMAIAKVCADSGAPLPP